MVYGRFAEMHLSILSNIVIHGSFGSQVSYVASMQTTNVKHYWSKPLILLNKLIPLTNFFTNSLGKNWNSDSHVIVWWKVLLYSLMEILIELSINSD